MNQPLSNQPPMPVPTIGGTPQSNPSVIMQPNSTKKFDPRIFFIALIVIGLGGGIYFGMKQLPVEDTPIPPIVQPTSAPTRAVKPMLPIATQSAFITLLSDISSLSASLNAIQISDTTLVPPTIELPLGFPN